MTIIEPVVTLEWITPNAVQMIEAAARTCYKSEPKGDPEGFVRRVCFQNHHQSVVEHAVASIRFVTDCGIGREITRHRIASYSQESTRYVDYTKDSHGGGDIQFIPPLGLTPEQADFAIKSFWTMQEIYNNARSLGMTPEQARDFLPLATKTELVMTANFREWLHFGDLRVDKAAHPKMRVVAGLAMGILARECPPLFSQYAPQS